MALEWLLPSAATCTDSHSLLKAIQSALIRPTLRDPPPLAEQVAWGEFEWLTGNQ